MLLVEAGVGPDAIDRMSFRDMQLALEYIHHRPGFGR